jgi:hypothetical protein
MRTELPEKWCVKNENKCLLKYASQIPNNSWGCDSNNSYYFYEDANTFYFESKIPEDHIEITLEEFERLVLKIIPTEPQYEIY